MSRQCPDCGELIDARETPVHLCGPGAIAQRANFRQISAQLEVVALRRWLARLMAIVERQAEDDGIFFRAESAVESYLQQAIRELHRAIEGEDA